MPYDINNIIEEKKEFIKEKTGNEVRWKVKGGNNPFGAFIDFPNWRNRKELPEIILKKGIGKVHFLHELIHLEKFFIDQCSVIAYNDPNLHRTLDIFKNIPENYVAHKTIKEKYGFDPIDTRWFNDKDSLKFSDRKIAANFVNFYCYHKFHPEYKEGLISFYKNCKEQKPEAFSMAERTIKVLEEMNYKERDSYNKCSEEIIKIFVRDYYDEGKIYLSYFSKEKDEWCWNP